MDLAILSDIHDQIWNLDAALHFLRQRSLGGIVCCGDICSPFVVKHMLEALDDNPVPIHMVWGNNDGDAGRIMALARGYPFEAHHELAELVVGENTLTPRQAFEAGGGDFAQPGPGLLRVAVNHYDAIARALAASGHYDLVCFGHNHALEVDHQSDCLLLNPGALMGYAPGPPAGPGDVHPTFAMVQVPTLEVTVYRVAQPSHGPADPGRVEEMLHTPSA